jgi:hypothetical protein
MSTDEATSVSVFINPGVTGTDMLGFFLNSGAVKTRVLASFLEAETGKIPSGRKEQISLKARDILDSSESARHRFLLKYAQDPRKWASLRIGRKVDIMPELADPANLLYQMGEERWYGPLQSDDSDSIFILRPHVVNYPAKEKPASGAPGVVNARWLVVAELHRDYVTLGWDGFSVRSQLGGKGLTQFPYWDWIPKMHQELERLIGGEWGQPPLYELLIKRLWDEFYEDPESNWRHLRIRALQNGVSLNASGGLGKVSEVNIKGLSALTNALALAVIHRLRLRREESLEAIERAITQTLIRDWGALSYEFSMDLGDELRASMRKELLKIHCYFGNRPKGHDIDSLQHFRCFLEAGGSREIGALIVKLLRRYRLD